jgi:hypothetical protein
MPSTTIARGNSHETFYIGPSITPASVAANTTAVQTFALPGLQTTDIIVAQGYIANQTTGIFIAECDCLTANVLTIQFGNVTASPATPAYGVYEFQIVRSEGPLPVTAV